MNHTQIPLDKLKLDVEADLAKYQTELYAKKKMSRVQKEYIFEQTVFATKTLIELGKKVREAHSATKFPAVDENGEPIIFGSVRHVLGIQDAFVATGQQLKSYLWCAQLEGIADKIESYFGISFNGLRIHKLVRHKTTGKLEFVLTLHDYADEEYAKQRDSVTLGSYEKRHNFIKYTEFKENYEYVQ